MNLSDHLEKLTYFYEVARQGSMKKAADKVFITQPSLTKSIKSLEEAIGKPVFIRLPRGVELTQEGRVLYDFCHELFNSVKDLEKRLLNPSNPFAGSIRVGTYDSIAIYFWPDFLLKFLKAYPALDLELSTGRSSEMQVLLEQGALDLIFTVEPQKTSQIFTEILYEDTFSFYTTTAKKRAFTKDSSAPLIFMPSANSSKGSLEQYLHLPSLSGRRTFTTSSLESIKEMTLKGIGIGILPKRVAEILVGEKKLVEHKFKGIPAKGIAPHKVGVAFHKTRQDSKLIQTIIAEIKQHLL